jgi:hypothetical protein
LLTSGVYRKLRGWTSHRPESFGDSHPTGVRLRAVAHGSRGTQAPRKNSSIPNLSRFRFSTRERCLSPRAPRPTSQLAGGAPMKNGARFGGTSQPDPTDATHGRLKGSDLARCLKRREMSLWALEKKRQFSPFLWDRIYSCSWATSVWTEVSTKSPGWPARTFRVDEALAWCSAWGRWCQSGRPKVSVRHSSVVVCKTL